MKIVKNKSIKWWVGVVFGSTLFIIIGIFSYIKADDLIYGVQINASISKTDSSSIAEIKGEAIHATYLSLNGREIFIDKDGSFTEHIALLPGLSVVTLEAEDKFGKKSEKKFQVMYQESTGVVAVSNMKYDY